MDNRHQSEREYIRYHGATSGEHLVAGIHGLAHGTTWKHFFVWLQFSQKKRIV